MRNLIDDEIKKKSNDEHNEKKSRRPKKAITRSFLNFIVVNRLPR